MLLRIAVLAAAAVAVSSVDLSATTQVCRDRDRDRILIWRGSMTRGGTGTLTMRGTMR